MAAKLFSLLLAAGCCISIALSLDLTGEKAATFGFSKLTYGNDEFKDVQATTVTVPQWSMNSEYSMCPPGKPFVQKWFFRPKLGEVRTIATQESPSSQLLLAPGIKLKNNCLVVKNLTNDWQGTFYFAPKYKTVRKWAFLNVTAEADDPSFMFESITAPSAPLRLCPPLSFYKQGAGGSIRWHYTTFGARGHFQLAYRYQADYWWFGYKYSVYEMEAKSSKLKVAMAASACVDVQPGVGSFVYVTSSSDPKGDRNIKRKVWFFRDPQGSHADTPTRLGIMAALINPDYFYKYETDQYKYHYTYFDMDTSIIITEHRTIQLENKDITLCASQYSPAEANWQFFPSYIKSRKQSDGKLILHRNSISLKHILTSQGFTYSGDYRCITIKNAGADVAGDLYYVPGLSSDGSVWGKESSKFTLLAPVGEAEYTPRSVYRKSYVNYGDKNVWICPSRHGQITQTDISMYLEDPVTQQKVLLLRRNEWHSGMDYYDFGQRHYYNSEIVYSPDSTACMVVPEINNITLGKYKFVFSHTPLNKGWTEIIDVAVRPPRRPRSLPITEAPPQEPNPYRKIRSVCDGCKEFNYRFNKKYARRDESLSLQGYLDMRLKAENCSITWKNPQGAALVTVTHDASATYHREDLFDGRYQVIKGNGAFVIKKILPQDEGVWNAFIGCPSVHDSFTVLTQLFLVDTVEHISGDPFSEVETAITNIPGKTAVTITQNGQKPKCFDEPEPRRCEYLPETDQLVFYLFDMEDTGLWVLNYTIPHQQNYVRLITASLETTPGCFVPRQKNVYGLLDPNWQFRDQTRLLWSKSVGNENPILKPICALRGGYFVRTFDRSHTCFFSGKLDVKNHCGLYWAYAYRQNDNTIPVSISAYYVKCSEEEEAPVMVCPPVGAMVNPGDFVESPYPQEQSKNYTIITTFRGANDSATQQICYAEEGWAMWNKTFCLWDGSFKPSVEYCGTQYTFAYDSKKYSSAQLLRHIVLCPKNSTGVRSRRSPRVAPFDANGTDEQDMIVPVVHDKEGSVTNIIDVSEYPETSFTIMIDINATSAEMRDPGDFIVIPIMNSSTTTGIILASLLILLMFFALWLYCKWKKSRKQLQSADYEKAPIYYEKN